MDSGEMQLSFAAGHRVGAYTIVRPLGAGAFGAVYEARKEPLGKRVALKLLHRDKARSANITARFLQEAQAAASLRHPHIVDVDDAGEVDGMPYLAMEFLEGESLAVFLKREGPLSPAGMLEVLLPVFSAVAAVHVRGIVHRDLKPDNIFLWKPVAGQLHPKLLDFGIAKVREGNDGAGLTQSGAIMGTPLYMSPEQWGGSKYASAQSDQWALGVIAFHCLTGRLPFEAEEIPAMMMRISAHPPEPLRALAPSVPETLELVVLRALEKSPTNRHASVRDFARALLPFASAAVRARWATEFGGESSALQSLDTVNASMPATAGSIPDTLNSSVKEIAAPATPARPWTALRVAALLGAVALTAGVVVAGWAALGERASAARSAASPPPAAAPSAPPAVAPPVQATVAAVPTTSPVALPPSAINASPPPAASPPAREDGRGRRHHRSRSRGGEPSAAPMVVPAAPSVSDTPII